MFKDYLRVSSSFVAVEGYSVVRGDVQGLIRKHGVCLYIRDSVRFVEIDLGCQNLAAVHLVKYDLFVLSVYRPPSYTDQENISLIRMLCEFCEGL